MKWSAWPLVHRTMVLALGQHSLKMFPLSPPSISADAWNTVFLGSEQVDGRRRMVCLDPSEAYFCARL